MSPAVILAVDPGVHRLGLATCDLVTGAPVWCGSEAITRPDGGWRHQQIGQALAGATICWIRDHFGFRSVPLEPAIVAIEDPTHAARGNRAAARWGEVIALIEAEALRRWPHIECWRISPPGWKKAIGLPGNCPATTYTQWAVGAGWAPPDGDAAAACIAMWAHTTNLRGAAA